MVSPPSRPRTSGEWRVSHPPPRQVAVGVSCKPRARTKARTNATNAWPSCSRRKEGASSWKATVRVRLWRGCVAAVPKVSPPDHHAS
jgi:hypothetical protein